MRKILSGISGYIVAVQTLSYINLSVRSDYGSVNPAFYFNERILKTRSDERSAIYKTDQILKKANKTKLVSKRYWFLHAPNNIQRSNNYAALDSFWKQVKYDIVSDENRKKQIFRFTIACYGGYFQFLIERTRSNKWVIYKAEDEWMMNNKIQQIPNLTYFRTIITEDQWNNELYNYVRSKYGLGIELDNDAINEFMSKFEKYSKKATRKEYLMDSLTSKNVFDREICCKIFEPGLMDLTWQQIKLVNDYELVEIIPIAIAEKIFVKRGYDIFKDAAMYENFLFAYKEVECEFGFAQIFGHLINSEIEMIKLEYFE